MMVIAAGMLLFAALGQEPQVLDTPTLRAIGAEWFPEVVEDGNQNDYGFLLGEIGLQYTPNHVRWWCHDSRQAVLAEHERLKSAVGLGYNRVGCLRCALRHAQRQETFVGFMMKGRQ